MKKIIKFKGIKKIYVLGTTDNLVNFIEEINGLIDFEIILHPKQAYDQLFTHKNNLKNTLEEKSYNFKIKKKLLLFNNKIFLNCLVINFGSYFNFKKDFIIKNKDRLFNFMPVPLPEFRGGAHVTWAIMKNQKNWGSCFQEIDTHTKQGGYIDNGYILDKILYRIPNNIKNPYSFFKLTSYKDKKIIKKFVNKILKNKKFNIEKLNLKNSLFYPRLKTKKDAFIKWEWKKRDIVSFINSFSQPYPGAISKFKTKKIFLSNARSISNEKFHPFQSGLVARIDKRGIYIITADGLIRVKNIKNSKGNDFLNNIKVGNKLENFKGIKKVFSFKNANKKIKLIGKKVIIRNLVEKDCNNNYLSWLNSEKTNQFLETRWKRQSINSIKNFVSEANYANNQHILGIVSKRDGVHIGNIKIFEINNFHKSAQIGYFIGNNKNWGKGYSTEAIKLIVNYGFKVLKLKYIYAILYADNIGSKKALKKNNFKVDGIFKKKIIFKNKRKTELSMSIYK